MKAIVKINAENVSVSLAGVKISVNLVELSNSLNITLPLYICMFRQALDPILPQEIKDRMDFNNLNIDHIQIIIGFIHRYLKICDGLDLVASIEFIDNGDIINNIEKCSFTLNFMDYLELFKEIMEYIESLNNNQ